MIFALVTLVWSARFNRDPDVTLLYREKTKKIGDSSKSPQCDAKVNLKHVTYPIRVFKEWEWLSRIVRVFLPSLQRKLSDTDTSNERSILVHGF